MQEYTQGFGLTEREFKLIKEQLEPGSRMFLVKQAHHSVVCQLDLKGFDGELAVISGRARKCQRMQRIIAATRIRPEHGCRHFMAGTRSVTGPTTHVVDSHVKRSSGLSACCHRFAGRRRARRAGAMGGHRCRRPSRN